MDPGTSADGSAQGAGLCPRCGTPLSLRPAGSASLAFCPSCGGAWHSHDSLRQLCASRYLPRLWLSWNKDGKAGAGRSCVVCGEAMARRSFVARGGTVVIDLCRAHGIWFDPTKP